MPPPNPPRPPHEPPTPAEFGLRRAYLAQQGMSQAQIDAAIGQYGDGRSRRHISSDLRTWLKEQT